MITGDSVAIAREVAGQVGIGDKILGASRLRHFGGTSGHWGGWCRPLDPVDFEPV